MNKIWCKHITFNANKWRLDIPGIILGVPVPDKIENCPICQATRPDIKTNNSEVLKEYTPIRFN